MPCCRVHHQTGGFIDHDQVVILVDHIKLNGLGLIVQFRRDLHFQGQALIADQLVLGPDLGTIDRQHPVLVPALQPRAGKPLEQLGSGLVDPLSRLICADLLTALNFLAAKMSHSATCV